MRAAGDADTNAEYHLFLVIFDIWTDAAGRAYARDRRRFPRYCSPAIYLHAGASRWPPRSHGHFCAAEAAAFSRGALPIIFSQGEYGEGVDAPLRCRRCSLMALIDARVIYIALLLILPSFTMTYVIVLILLGLPSAKPLYRS